MRKPLLLMILDGWGMPEKGEADALSLAKLPNFRRLWQEHPHTSLSAAGMDVGLPEGQMGNSEVGHMNIGAGRVIYQEYTLITKAIREGTFFENPALLAACRAAKQQHGALHLLGLLSDGGVHSHSEHLRALLQLAKRQGVENVFVHCFLDGRDTPTDAGLGYVQALERFCAAEGVGRIATVCGRFYAMDRDKRWQRVQRAYEMMVYGRADHTAVSAEAAVSASYARGQSDEFMEPTVIVDAAGQPLTTIGIGDSVIFFNFRADRAREISHALTDAVFDGFDRGVQPPRLSCYTTMTAYDDTLQGVEVAFPPHGIKNNLAQVLAANSLHQLRIAETEKYAHVTFFFNGGVEDMVPGEDRVLIPSPKVETYDKQPEMSAEAVTDAVIERIESGIYDVIILNYANPDMVGHTGVLDAAVQAVECVDLCIGRVERAIHKMGGMMLITADHGNVERMREHGQPMTAHTTNQVPFILVMDPPFDGALRSGGRLEDIAPTILQLLHLQQPAEMTGRSLLI